jgi:hypothetical protein
MSTPAIGIDRLAPDEYEQGEAETLSWTEVKRRVQRRL